jgi:transcriptional regulator with XRE-family HTH domain
MATDREREKTDRTKVNPPTPKGTSDTEKTSEAGGILEKMGQWQERSPAPPLLRENAVEPTVVKIQPRPPDLYAVDSYGEQLQYERELQGWTREELAKKIGASVSAVQSWENDLSDPDPAFRQKLSQLFGNDSYLNKESQMQREVPREKDEQSKSVQHRGETQKSPTSHRGDQSPSTWRSGVPEQPSVLPPERFSPSTEIEPPPEFPLPLEETKEEQEKAIEGAHEQSPLATQGETAARDIDGRQRQTDEWPTQNEQESSKVPVNYGRQLQRERKRKGWTQERLAMMIGVPVSEVTSWEKNLSSPDRLSRRKLAELLGKDIYRTSEAVVKDTSRTSRADGTLQIRITQEQLTAQNFTTVISALTELHTKCWLIQQGRFVHTIEYAQTRNVKFAEEANLVITKMAYNSPLAITFAPLDPKNIADALVVAIDGTVQAGQRLVAVKIANQEKGAQIQQAAKRAEQEYQAKQQELAIAAQKAAQESQMAQTEQERLRFELEKQRLTFQIEQERQKLELERQQVAIQREQLELVNMRMNYAIETANKMIGMLQPNADPTTRAMLVQTLLPSLLQLDSGKGLNLALPAPQNS